MQNPITVATAVYDKPALQHAAEAAIRAPSLHNSQPWLFGLRDGAIEIRVDPDRRLIADRAGWAARMACGAAALNARLALATAGRPAVAEVHPDPDDRDLVVRLTPARSRPPTYAESELQAAIGRRYSNRGPYWPDPVPSDVRMALLEAARSEAAWLDLLVGTTALTAFSEIAYSADRVLRRDARYQAELATWTHADRAPDGVPVIAGAPAAEPQDLLPQRLFTDRRRAPGAPHRHRRRPGHLDDQPADRGAGGPRPAAPVARPLGRPADRHPVRLRHTRPADPTAGRARGPAARSPQFTLTPPCRRPRGWTCWSPVGRSGRAFGPCRRGPARRTMAGNLPKR
jgi:hypothetical protein